MLQFYRKVFNKIIKLSYLYYILNYFSGFTETIATVVEPQSTNATETTKPFISVETSSECDCDCNGHSSNCTCDGLCYVIITTIQ